MKSPETDLWQIIRTREKSLAATRKFFGNWVQQERKRRELSEAVAKERSVLLTRAEEHVANERDARQREMAAKAQAQELLKAEAEAHARWERLCHEAERQLATLAAQLTTETKAHAVTGKLLAQTERQVAAVGTDFQREKTEKEKAQALLKTEAGAHQRWVQLCAEAEKQLATLRQQLGAAERRRAEEQQTREQEAAARQQTQTLLTAAEARLKQEISAREQEVAAKGLAQSLLSAAEAQRDRERSLREQEAAARQQSQTLLTAAEAQLKQEISTREQEITAKERAQALLKAAEVQRDLEQSLREQEVVAKERANTLLAAAEVQRDRERALREQEAAARQLSQTLLTAAEAQLKQELSAREQEIAAKERAQALLKAAEVQRDLEQSLREQEVVAKERANTLLAAAEVQRDRERASREQEATARLKIQVLLTAAEAQLKQELRAQEQEVAAKERAQSLLTAAEVQRDQERSLREQEASARQKTQALLAAAEARIKQELAARDQERAAKERAQTLLAAAEAQRDRERSLREQESSARQKTQALLITLENQISQERNARDQEAAAKGHALDWAKAAEAAKSAWERLCHEAEAQRDGLAQSLAVETGRTGEARARLHELTNQMDRLNADQAQALSRLSALTAQISHAAFGRELEAEHLRQQLLRRTWFGRWLGARNTAARWVRRVYCFAAQKPFAPDRGDEGPDMAQVNTHDLIGGAERASYDLHVSYRQRGLDPVLIVGGKFGQDPDVMKMPFRDIDWKPAPIWRDRWGLTEILYPTPFLGCFEWPYLRQAHIVHIHNMHGKYWNSATLLPLGMQHPVVLTLHDEYTMTGDCCYSQGCDRWLRSCGQCPQIGLDRGARYTLGERDLTRLNVQIKRFLFHAPRAYPLAIVTPSRWLAARARRSPNLRHLPVISINNGVDLDYWKPLPQEEARRALGLPEGKTIGLIVANYVSDPRKGFDVALAAIRLLPRDTNLLFVLVGNLPEEIKAQLAGLPVIATGFVGDKFKMLNLFSAADFTFSMSRMDNLPYMCVESLACGRPVFGSDVGGIPEIVNEPALGWLAPMPFNHRAIARTLEEIDAEAPAVRRQRFAACRNSAVARFGLNMMTDRYLALYQELSSAAAEGRPVDVRNIAPAAPDPK